MCDFRQAASGVSVKESVNEVASWATLRVFQLGQRLKALPANRAKAPLRTEILSLLKLAKEAIDVGEAISAAQAASARRSQVDVVVSPKVSEPAVSPEVAKQMREAWLRANEKLTAIRAAESAPKK